MKPDFVHASATFKRLNPHLFGVGALPPAKSEPIHRRSQGDARSQKAGESSLAPRGRVLLIRCARRTLDDDNLAASFKFLRDAIADNRKPGLPPGRADEYFKWEYAQISTAFEQGTIVLIQP